LGSNVLDKRSIIAGVGPITIDPGTQNLGIGRKLMQAVMEPCGNTPEFLTFPDCSQIQDERSMTSGRIG
jgi:hypothetical protein